MDNFSEKYDKARRTFNFEDLILLPGLSLKEPKDIELKARFSEHIGIAIPLVSSPMDTVTESAMAIALARKGGIGVIHRNCTAEEELEMVKRVKRAESFIIRDVVTIGKDTSVSNVAAIMAERNISGLPVIEGGRLIGIITGRDVRSTDGSAPVSSAMTKLPGLITATDGITEEKAIDLMNKHRIEKLPVIDSKKRLTGLITYKDMMLRKKYRDAIRDRNGRLMVAAAVSPFDMQRAVMLSEYADALVIDVAHFHNKRVVESTNQIIKKTNVDIIAGNLGTREGVKYVVDNLDRVSGLRVGIGSGSICITTDVTRAGSPTLFAVAQAAAALEEAGLKIPIIADGGIRAPGDAALAFAFGASAVMLGYGFAGTDESPGRIIDRGGQYYKEYRGMGSRGAREKRRVIDRYADTGGKKLDEGIETYIPYKGKVDDVIEEFSAGIRAAIGYAGATDIGSMRNAKVAKVDGKGHKLSPKRVESAA